MARALTARHENADAAREGINQTGNVGDSQTVHNLKARGLYHFLPKESRWGVLGGSAGDAPFLILGSDNSS